MLAANRELNRLVCVAESIRRFLDDPARVIPDWTITVVTPDWIDRYSKPFDSYRLPDKPTEQVALQAKIGQNGWHLLGSLYGDKASVWLREFPSVKVMRHVRIQPYWVDKGQFLGRDQTRDQSDWL